ncbi:type 1 glutamine amidotransferase [Pseudomarimonas arenosa]|uniref:Gamma-glutamyl-gamma-aminobutyrate hydrolase family protein n=1 Tax=Pseudomarimonas arenosa TaxID=2774145 RepID=A0AAW3ZEH2_9GAMM|nr:gamma-glutamyl-gamma-aminobutyrate hydrolase family protein [Pseudomarimonas arenosa]MBD8524521.1 gamma-glutamyl-gamma-aminobutyrate hydrolase family protein [Pseudomarimonas arenosa]
MSKVLVFQHVAAEPLGTLDALIRARGHRIRFVNFEREPEAQPDVDRYQGLIVLGGPMNVSDQAHRAHLRTELRCIERALRQGKPVLGICLGSQLLAHALGATVRRHHLDEIGWYRWQPTEHAQHDSVLAPLAQQSPIFQWHSCTFDIPHDAVHLGRTDSCENQAFRYGDNAYGFQFHLEMDRPLIERWLSNPEYRRELESCGLNYGAAEILADTEQHIALMQANATVVFNRFLDQIGRPRRRLVLRSREWE